LNDPWTKKDPKQSVNWKFEAGKSEIAKIARKKAKITIFSGN